MITTIAKQYTFDAAHQLDRFPPDHKCSRMHGHTYRVALLVTGQLTETGIVMDYAEIDEIWKPLFDELDHRVLNEIPGLEIPTTEHLAAWVWVRVYQQLSARAVRRTEVPFVCAVRVHESSATYCECTWVGVAEREQFVGRPQPAARRTEVRDGQRCVAEAVPPDDRVGQRLLAAEHLLHRIASARKAFAMDSGGPETAVEGMKLIEGWIAEYFKCPHSR